MGGEWAVKWGGVDVPPLSIYQMRPCSQKDAFPALSLAVFSCNIAMASMLPLR
ncbi:MAG: hypothetical protein ABIL06_02440 [Pseudomonadota bacterium]